MATGSDLIVTCASCGARNRKHLDRLGQAPVCARCSEALPAGGGPVAVDEATFDRVLEASQVPVLVDFWAPWCGPCRAFAPVLEKWAPTRAKELLVVKVDTEANPGAGRRHGITAIPTIAIFRGGREVARQAGAMSASQLEAWVKQATG